MTKYPRIRRILTFDHALLFFSLLTSILFLGICSKSSPLYPMNDWVDVHCFLTLGKGLLNGMIPYVDLYEQKGPVLYLIYAVVALFNKDHFFGQFLLEVLTFWLFLYFSGKLAQLHLGKSWLIFPIITVLALITGTCYAFSHGGSVEQICLFMFSYGLWTVSRAIHDDRPLSTKEAVLNGLFAAIAFWIKYTMMGFYAGLALSIIIWHIFKLRDWKALLKTAGLFILGFISVSAAVLFVYFLFGALEELFTCYFYNNLFLYPAESEVPLLQQIWEKLGTAMELNGKIRFFLLLGLAYLLIEAKDAPLQITTAVLSFVGLSLTTYMGKGYSYYSLVLVSFTVFGLIAAGKILQLVKLPKIFHYHPSFRDLARAICVAIATIYCMTFALANSRNVYLMSYDRMDMPQYKFAEIMHRTHEDPKILNLGFLDGGFYYAADSLPECPFFCTFNINAPGMWKTQYRYIEEGKVDYVITRHYTLDRYRVDASNYVLVDTASMCFEGYDFTYYLYQHKDIT